MVHRDFHNKLDIDRVISDLKREETVQYTVSLLHMLGDFSIGQNSNYQESIIKRIVVLMSFADMKTPYYGVVTPYLKGKRGTIHWEEKTVQEKSAQVLATILGKVNNRHGNNDYDKESVPIMNLPLNLIVNLIEFYSFEDNIPIKDPARRAISGFLELAYNSLMVSEKDYSYLKPFISIYEADKRSKNSCRKLLVLPLIIIGKIKLLLHNLDLAAIAELEWQIHLSTKIKVSGGLTEAFEYWLGRSKEFNNGKALKMIEACEVCMLLKSVKPKQTA